MINSFAVVADNRSKREVALLIYSIRRIYNQSVFLTCDEPTKLYLSKFNFDNIHYDIKLNPKGIKKYREKLHQIRKCNDFHSRVCISAKMDCLEGAVKAYDNTMFLDADIIILDEIDDGLDLNLDGCLSPHYHAEEVSAQNIQYGIMNAGYLWVNNCSVARVWRDIYYRQSSFYEQEGMRHFLTHYNMNFFNLHHNVGFWRFKKVWKKGRLSLEQDTLDLSTVKSLHCHYFDETFRHANVGLKTGYLLLRDIVREFLPKEIKDFTNDL